MTEKITYTIYCLKIFLNDIKYCKYCLKKWRGGGTICICCSIEIQNAYINRNKYLIYKHKITSIFKPVLEDIIYIGLLPNRIYQTLLADTMNYFKDFRNNSLLT